MSTIKDVAERTGLSVATISKYLNGGPVKTKNRERIQVAIDELDYKVNPFARSLKTRKSYTIGALFPALSAHFFGSIISTMDKVFRAKDYNMIISCYDADAALEAWKLESFINSGVDGLIYLPEHMNADTFNELMGKTSIPVVLVDRLIPSLNLDSVVVNNSGVVYSATERLIKKGHKRLGYIAGLMRVFTARERFTGLERVLADYGIEMDRSLVKEGAYTVSDGYRLFNELVDMKDPPTAIIATNYDLTLGAITAASERGIRLPQDIDFLGFDCYEIGRLMNPPICTIEQPEQEIGQMAAEYLMGRIEGLEGPPRLARLKAIINEY